MKKSPYPLPSGKSAAIDRITERLKEAIRQLPIVSMVSSVKFPGELEYSDVKKTEEDAIKAIKALSVFAELGREDAAIALRNLGNLAAKELNFLVPDPIAATAKKNRTIRLESPNLNTVYLLPVVKIQGDLSPLEKILKSEEETIKSLSDADIRTRLINPRSAGGRQCVVDALSALGIKDDVFDEQQRLMSEESVGHNHPVSTLDMLYGEIERSKDLYAKKTRQERTRIAVYELIGTLLEDELFELSKAGSGELPSNSFEWPLCVSAFSNDLSQRSKSLKLGHSLQFVPRGTADKGAGKIKKSAAGRHRLVEPGKPAHFALEYCIALDGVRRLYINASASEKADWGVVIRRIEEAIEQGVGGDPNNKLADPLKYTDHKKPQYHTSLSLLWTLKAALLPEFPYPERDSDMATEDALNLWVGAAVARAMMMCGNDWEYYRGWPECVDVRSSQKESAYSAVNEKLKEGMKRLERIER